MLLEQEVPVCFIGYTHELSITQFNMLFQKVEKLRQLPTCKLVLILTFTHSFF